jgi:hypothetical protein
MTSKSVATSISRKPVISKTNGAAQKRRTEKSVLRSKNGDVKRTTNTTATGRQAAKPVRVKVQDVKVKPNRVTVNDIKTRSASASVNKIIQPRSPRPTKTSLAKTNKAVATTTKTQRQVSQTMRKPAARHARRSAPAVTNSKVNKRIANKGGNTQVRTSRSEHGGRSHGKHGASSKIIINGNNNVIVQGNATRHKPRPHFSRKVCRDVSYVNYGSSWHNHGSYYSFSWSNSSCGVVASFRYPSRYYGHYGRRWSSSRHCYGLSYYYPRYHRKYVFVSLGGYWPSSYRYRRYYWYGCHPHYWYGSNVIAEPYYGYNVYNNYYVTNTTGGYTLSNSGSVYEVIQQPEVIDEPEYESPSDICFSGAVEMFEKDDYEAAAEQFRQAVQLAPDDVVVPFTYSQALFAAGNYAHAAGVLRGAIAQIPEDEMTIYYPRGLYADEKTLEGQVRILKKAVDREPFASDYQLLLGYQYLGLGHLDKAFGPLTEAAKDPANQLTAGRLIDLAAALEAEED